MNRPVNQRHSGRTSSRTLRVLAILSRSLISLALIGLSVFVFIKVGRGRAPDKTGPAAAAVPVVEVLGVAPHDGGISFDVDGVVIPFRQIEVPAEVAGRIEFKSDNCQPGHVVKQGETLIRIDQREYDLELRSLEEDVKQAEANLAELIVEIAARKRQIELSREDLVIKQREMERYTRIQDPGVYAKSELDAARLKELQARDALQTEQDQLELLEARRTRLGSAIELGKAHRDRAALDLARTEVVAPIDGVITREGPEQGGYVQRGGMVAVVQDTSLMEIRCSLPMYQMNWLWRSGSPESQAASLLNAYQLPETPCTVEFEVGLTRYRWRGTLAYFDSAQVDRQTRMVPCRVTVRNPQEVEVEGSVGAAVRAPITLMAGMFVKVRVHTSPHLALLTLPASAVQPGNHVWIVRPDTGDTGAAGRLHRSEIQIAHAEGDTVLAYAAQSGLEAGDLVVVSPLASPSDNALVEIMEGK